MKGNGTNDDHEDPARNQEIRIELNRHRVTTGPVEGINNKIKVLKRKAYGYRDMEYFKLRIYFLNKARYALLG